MHGMNRHALALIVELLGLFPCVAIAGVRQCGKTTLLGQIPGDWRIHDLEKQADAETIARDPDLFFRLNPDRVAIDECQLQPRLFPALRVAIDSDRNRPGRYVITGSSSPDLLSAMSESLAGRVAIVELSPFGLAEAHGHPPSGFFPCLAERRPLRDYLGLPARLEPVAIHDYWLRGGYPETWLKNQPRFTKLWMQNYLQTYLDRDLPRLFPGLDREKFRLFANMLAHLSGRVINYSEVARALGASQPTARDYFRIADGTFLWRHLPAYDKDAVKRVVKHPKGFLRDSGLLHYLLRLQDMEQLRAHPGMGASWEGMVIETLLRGLDVQSTDYRAYHYRTGAGAEVDLVLEGEFGLLPIEIKYTQHVDSRSLRAIRDFVEERCCPYGIVLNNDERPRMLDEKLVGVPVGCL
ncbi:MAG: ATP-binding protein [Gammaproteobacteria bacterium]|nr:ATP-binding protein [Gammaproteobacteria bacterium]MBU1655440.1 ATP-binding protein [Gammaproteobacteria bacterium]MBU1962407.1 ATP-binding protein [Gammaproteobacteria bacterium]